MPAEASSTGAQMLSKVPEECARCEAELQRTQLFALLCKYQKEQAPQSGLVPGEENSQRCLEAEAWVYRRLLGTYTS